MPEIVSRWKHFIFDHSSQGHNPPCGEEVADEMTWSMILGAWVVTCLYFSRSESRDL